MLSVANVKSMYVHPPTFTDNQVSNSTRVVTEVTNWRYDTTLIIHTCTVEFVSVLLWDI